MRPSPALLVATALLGCSETDRAPERGTLWPYRERIAEALTFRTGVLSSTVGKKARPCIHYWAGDHTARAERLSTICDANALDVQDGIERYLKIDVADADVRDPALWQYISKRVRL